MRPPTISLAVPERFFAALGVVDRTATGLFTASQLLLFDELTELGPLGYGLLLAGVHVGENVFLQDFALHDELHKLPAHRRAHD